MIEPKKIYVEPFRIEDTFSSLHGFHSLDCRCFLDSLLNQLEDNNTFVLDVPYEVSTKLSLSQATAILEKLGMAPKDIRITKSSFPFGKHTIQIFF